MLEFTAKSESEVAELTNENNLSPSVGTLTEAELVALLSSIRGAKAIGLTVETDARLKKTGNLFGNVSKVSRISALVNFHYDTGVLRRLEAEGKSPDEFRKGTSWHVAVLTEDDKLTPFCQNPKTGELYLRVQLTGRGETRYFTQEGKEVTETEIEPWLPKKENAYENQGTSEGNRLVFLTYKLSSVVNITVDDESYDVVK